MSLDCFLLKHTEQTVAVETLSVLSSTLFTVWQCQLIEALVSHILYQRERWKRLTQGGTSDVLLYKDQHVTRNLVELYDVRWRDPLFVSHKFGEATAS